jgi:D-amino-acid oxidase
VAIVVGSGVCGLTCAASLLESGHDVEIWARQRPPHTTSNVAAAFWFPYRAYPQDAVIRWSRVSWQRFAALAREPDAGITMRRAYDLTRTRTEDSGQDDPDQHDATAWPKRPWWADAVPTLRQATQAELPEGFGFGWVFEAPVIDTRRYLPWLMRRVEHAGARFVTRDLISLDEALARDDVVVNCTGLGARTLCHDDEVVPIRGQVVHVSNPGVEAVFLDEYGPEIAYVVPRGDDCVLGGTAELGCEDLDVDAVASTGILERACALVPALRNATKLADVVGLRPGRSSVRVAAQSPAPGKRLVHDYGHGGAGVTLSWGCALDVVSLVEQQIEPRPVR